METNRLLDLKAHAARTGDQNINDLCNYVFILKKQLHDLPNVTYICQENSRLKFIIKQCVKYCMFPEAWLKSEFGKEIQAIAKGKL